MFIIWNRTFAEIKKECIRGIASESLRISVFFLNYHSSIEANHAESRKSVHLNQTSVIKNHSKDRTIVDAGVYLSSIFARVDFIAHLFKEASLGGLRC